MTTRRLAVAALAFAAVLTAGLMSSASAQTGQPDVPGHASAMLAPSDPSDRMMTPALPSFLMDGFSRMALAVSHWSIASQPVLKTGARRAAAGRSRVAR